MKRTQIDSIKKLEEAFKLCKEAGLVFVDLYGDFVAADRAEALKFCGDSFSDMVPQMTSKKYKVVDTSDFYNPEGET